MTRMAKLRTSPLSACTDSKSSLCAENPPNVLMFSSVAGMTKKRVNVATETDMSKPITAGKPSNFGAPLEKSWM